MEQSLHDRTLEILADGVPVPAPGRLRLSGRDRLGLFPEPWTLTLSNLSEESFLRLSRSAEIAVRHEGKLLAAGRTADVFRRPSPEGTLTFACFSPGLPLWEAPVSLSLEAGVTVSETVRRLLEASGTGLRLLSFPGRDPVLPRGQAFLGRAAECLEEALSAAGARACLTPAGLCAVPEEGLPVTLSLSEADLLSAPSAAAGGRLVLRTDPAGWSVGQALSVSWNRVTARGLVAERAVEADTARGPWQAEMIVELFI